MQRKVTFDNGKPGVKFIPGPYDGIGEKLARFLLTDGVKAEGHGTMHYHMVEFGSNSRIEHPFKLAGRSDDNGWLDIGFWRPVEISDHEGNVDFDMVPVVFLVCEGNDIGTGSWYPRFPLSGQPTATAFACDEYDGMLNPGLAWTVMYGLLQATLPHIVKGAA